MTKKSSSDHIGKKVLRLSLPLICTVALGGPSLIPVYAIDNPPQEESGGDTNNDDAGGGGNTSNNDTTGDYKTSGNTGDDVKSLGTTFSTQQTEEKPSYTYDADLYSKTLPESNEKPYAGVYSTKELDSNAPEPGKDATSGVYETKDSDAETIGMPSIADANLVDAPTTESPAIIVGSAVGYEKRTVNPDGSISYSYEDGVEKRDTVYDEFKRIETTEQKADQTTAHTKITGYDGTYVIVRLNVSGYFTEDSNENEEKKSEEKSTTKYLHVKQKDNNTLLTATGWTQVDENLEVKGPMQTDGVTPLTDGNTYTASLQAPSVTTETRTDETTGEEYEVYKDTATGTEYKLTWKDPDAKTNTIIRTGSYTKEQLTDQTDGNQYLDVLVFATAGNVAGADAGKEGQLSGDVPISMYVDGIDDYQKGYGQGDEKTADPFYDANCLGKFFDATTAVKQAASAGKAIIVSVSKYLVKGSDLALETMVENSDENNDKTTYWSLEKSFENDYYDQSWDSDPNDPRSGRTVSLMSEVAITDELNLTGNNANDVRKRTLDVNSFDVQVATNTGTEGKNTVGFNLKNAWLTIADFSNTTGSEFAIGNNSTCTIDEGGRLIIDETCQLEIEWDGATQTPAQGEEPQKDILNNGFLNLMKGGTVVNNGVITIEGTEGKPYAPETKETVVSSEKGCGVFLVDEGATLINNGCMIVYGRLYNLGTVVNNGRFDDVIASTDPDKGTYKYHKGIQVSWKDDVSQDNIIPGGIINGRGPDSNKYVESATIINRGDILLVPGVLVSYGELYNERSGRILECPVTEAYIPVELLPTDPKDKNPMELWTVTKVYEEKRKRDATIPAKDIEESYVFNYGTLVNRGDIATGTVKLGLVLTDVYFDELSVPGEHPDVFYFEGIGDSASVTNYGYIPGIPTVPEPTPAPKPQPRPTSYTRIIPDAQDSSDDSDSSSGTDNAAPTSTGSAQQLEQKPESTKYTIHRITKEESADTSTVKQTITNTVQSNLMPINAEDKPEVEVSVVSEPKVEQIADGVYEIVSMPEVDVEALVEDDGDHSAENIETIWWCVEIDGEMVRVMDILGNLAPGIARVVWADNADLAQATLVGIDLGDGRVIVIGPDTALFLDIVWS